MHLSPARFVSVIGTEVHANPKSAADAKVALKELRQKKKEFGLRRRALMAEAKKAREAAEEAEGPKRSQGQGLTGMIGKLIGKARARAPRQTLAELETELHATDEILFNIDSCTVQIEGKLLHLR